METGYEVNNSRQIDVKALIVAIALRWKKIILVGIIFCLLAGFQSFNSQRKEVAQTKQLDTERKMSTDIDYDGQQDDLQNAIEDRYEYLNNSVASELNPYSNSVAVLTLYIKSSNGETEDNASSTVTTSDSDSSNSSAAVSSDNGVNTILTTLDNYAKYGMNWKSLKKDLKIKEDVYLNELVDVETSGSTLTITGFYNNKKGAKKIVNTVNKQLKSKFNETIDTAGLTGYSLIQLDMSSTDIVNTDLSGWLHNRVTENNDYITDLANMDTYTDQVDKSSTNPGKTSISKKQILKRAIFGGIAGCCLVILFVLLKLLIGEKVLSSKELNYRYNTLNLLTIERKYNNSKITGFNKMICKWDAEEYSDLHTNDRIALALENLSQVSDGYQTIGLIGDVTGVELMDLAEKLSASDLIFISMPDVLNNINERKQFKDVDAVIVVAEVEKSKYSKLNELFDLCLNCKKDVIGTITC